MRILKEVKRERLKSSLNWKLEMYQNCIIWVGRKLAKCKRNEKKRYMKVDKLFHSDYTIATILNH